MTWSLTGLVLSADLSAKCIHFSLRSSSNRLGTAERPGNDVSGRIQEASTSSQQLILRKGPSCNEKGYSYSAVAKTAIFFDVTPNIK